MKHIINMLNLMKSRNIWIWDMNFIVKIKARNSKSNF